MFLLHFLRSVSLGCWPAMLLALLLPAVPALAAEVPAFASVRDAYHSSYAELHDRHGEPLYARRMDMGSHRLAWVPLEQVSPALRDAVIFSEDRDFYRHHGIDWGATARAMFKLAGGDKSRGASTITMQVAAQVDDGLRWRKGGRSVSQKWRQMRAARALESEWSKDQILEAYFNLTWFRGDLQGVAAASQALFQKSPRALTRAEALLLASLLPSPGASSARVAQRACVQIAAGFPDTDCQTVKDLAFSVLDRRRPPVPDNPALDALGIRLLKVAGEQKQVSLDARIQRQAEAALQSQLAELQAQQVSAGAVLVLDNATGEVLAYVANAGRVESARFVDGVQALRQAGSTLKPFLFEQAIEKRYLTAASILEDAPLSLATPTGLYAPQNYEKDYKGPVTARTALAGSLNIPTVRVLTLVGVEPFWQRLRDLGFASLTEAPDFYGYALALGSADVNLWMLANAYRTLANGGRYSEAGFDVSTDASPASDVRQVLAADATFIVNDILSDRGARAITFGWESPLSMPFWAAVKTGTSKDMRDNWCIGFSERYTIAVWVGNLDGSAMHDVSGITGAAPVWAQLMRALEGGRVRVGEPGPTAPDTVLRQQVSFSGISEPMRQEWFLPGTEMPEVVFTRDSSVRILYPAAETLMALDPDIPPERQRVRFRAERAGEALEWWLDGKRLGPATDFDWAPQAGSHRLQLKDKKGRTRDSVLFTVRGRWSGS